MKSKTVAILLISFFVLCSFETIAGGKGKGSVSVNGYYRSNGTYVAPHYRSAPDGNFYNNWSTYGNVNPYTGKEGTKTEPSSGTGIGTLQAMPQVYIPPNNDGANNDLSNQPAIPSINDKSAIPLSNTTKSNSQYEMPANSKIDYTGHSWECKYGFKQIDNECYTVLMPAHAKIDYTGHSWECQHGFVQNGTECNSVQMPAGAKIDYTGHSWECQYGFKQIGNECIQLKVAN